MSAKSQLLKTNPYDPYAHAYLTKYQIFMPYLHQSFNPSNGFHLLLRFCVFKKNNFVTPCELYLVFYDHIQAGSLKLDTLDILDSIKLHKILLFCAVEF